MQNPLGQGLRELPGPLLLTGHTGFKGTWMSFLLEHLNVPVVGYSLPAEKDSLYDRAERTGAIPEAFADIRDLEVLERFIDLHKPSTIIHMAAQPLVLKSYENPRETFEVNVMGTANLLDIAFKKDFVKAIIVVTTDKVYKNDNSGRAFIETDPLEGKDPYSASKVGTEAVAAAWQQIAKLSGGPKVASVRAGNVIGGGDYAVNRIIPDLIRGVITGSPVVIRNPSSTRPWQHVLDPLFGYLITLESTLNGLNVEAVNFGPVDSSISVEEIVIEAKEVFPDKLKVLFPPSRVTLAMEASSLDLDSTLASELLFWKPVWSQKQAINKTLEWWKQLLHDGQEAKEIVQEDVESYLNNLNFKIDSAGSMKND
jgi:CDP-glucose 4,6-dehydratase